MVMFPKTNRFNTLEIPINNGYCIRVLIANASFIDS